MNFLNTPSIDQPPVNRVWSPLQQAVFDACRQDRNILIQAVAGSGKTTTILEATRYAPGTSLFLAFNKSIAIEMQQRLTAGEAKTLNALGHRMWMQNMPSSRLEARKLDLILEEQLGKGSQLLKDYGYTIKRLVGLAKGQAFGIKGHTISQMDFEDLCDSYQFDVPVENLGDVAASSLKAFLTSVQETDTFDFDDQVYYPVYASWQPQRYDNCFVDESQDLSPIQHRMLDLLDSRVIAVGDRHQAIYGFRGACSDSMDLLKSKFDMVELPLDISYRCPQEVVREAQKYCAAIRAKDGAPQGIVQFRDADESDPHDPELFHEALIVCRNNAPLFRAILRHVRARKPCRVLTNFLEGFQGFIRHFRCGTSIQLLPKLELWYERERSAAESRGALGKLAGVSDKYETARLLCEQYRTVDEILGVIKQLGEGRTGPTFATIHKAKGLEHDSVYILRPDLMPAKYARSPEAKQQESNLTYVAITRSKRELTYGVTML